MPHADDYAFDLLMHILAEGRSSRLYRNLVVEKQLASSVNVYGAPGARYDNLMVISATPRYPHTPAELEAAIYTELDRIDSQPITREELDIARKRILTDSLRMLNSNSGLARMLSNYQVLLGDWRYLVTYEQAIRQVTPEDVAALVQRYLKPEQRTVVTLQREAGS